MGGVGPGKMSKHELFIQGSGKPAGWRGYFPEAAAEGKPGRTWKQKAWQLSSRAGPSQLPISGILAGRAWRKSSIFPQLYLSLVPENPPASPDVTDLARPREEELAAPPLSVSSFDPGWNHPGPRNGGGGQG